MSLIESTTNAEARIRREVRYRGAIAYIYKWDRRENTNIIISS